MNDNDKHDRALAARTAAEALADVGFDFETLGYSPEWWTERDRAVAEQRAKDATLSERSRCATRAGELLDNGFPQMFVAAAQADLRDTAAMRFASRVLHLPRKLLVLAGGVGAGKTTAATWLALKGQDPRPGFVRVGELERRGRYDKKLDAWLHDKTSLVIDDVGAEVLDGKAVFRALLDEIVDMFYANRRTLVMTTNLRPRKSTATDEDQFVERYGERVWSRFSQMAVWGDCGTHDIRKEKHP